SVSILSLPTLFLPRPFSHTRIFAPRLHSGIFALPCFGSSLPFLTGRDSAIAPLLLLLLIIDILFCLLADVEAVSRISRRPLICIFKLGCNNQTQRLQPSSCCAFVRVARSHQFGLVIPNREHIACIFGGVVSFAARYLHWAHLNLASTHFILVLVPVQVHCIASHRIASRLPTIFTLRCSTWIDRR
ncbi:uncharacterized protein BJ171DRAFT_611596, partial [Polychytrium aggregatum]|uniref:uncharacterized protein n=1 Tax=Polychytrium aggregatum TaxID=110093 RepID=UPI0022FE2911